DVLIRLLDVCDIYGIDLATEYERKMAFNRTRPYQHGGRTLSASVAAASATIPPTPTHPATSPAPYPATAWGSVPPLAAPGDSAATVAETLLRGGYTGTPGSCDTCPIAGYLLDVIPDATGVAVSENEAEVTTASGRLHVAMPPGPAGFITAFDNGGYD